MVGIQQNICNLKLIYQFVLQILLNPGVLMFQNDQVYEKAVEGFTNNNNPFDFYRIYYSMLH
jgi:hypothetical protein